MPPEVQRPLSPAERWFWITDQTAPLNVIARVRLTGQMLPSQPIPIHACASSTSFPTDRRKRHRRGRALGQTNKEGAQWVPRG